MFRIKLLPWEYGIRNLFRRPLRSGLTLAGLTIVIVLVLVVVGFIRGLENSLRVSGDPHVALVFAMGMGENLEYSAIPVAAADEVAALDIVQQRYREKYASQELYLGTQVKLDNDQTARLGLVRGVTRAARLVRQQVELTDGKWPATDEILVGRLAATKLGAEDSQLAIGKSVWLEGHQWRVSGHFSAAGSVFESELWCPLLDLQTAMQRQDLSLVALRLNSPSDFKFLDLFCQERNTLEIRAIQEPQYYQSLNRDYRPVRILAWVVVLLVSGAGVFAGLNTMYAAVLGRVRELATLQTLGFMRIAIVISLVQEGLLIAMTSSLFASLIALLALRGWAIKFTMGAFQLGIDPTCILIGCATGCLLGLIGSLPPAIRVMRSSIATSLKAI
ncbi:MAG TPA: FtsX-like permease family protein [Planctomycetes bacterium]|jgi:ABC-type lipoprotein release transport system permease subunit|nr:FtsX-like permease family protein [Planctomycetota bacterium]